MATKVHKKELIRKQCIEQIEKWTSYEMKVKLIHFEKEDWESNCDSFRNELKMKEKNNPFKVPENYFSQLNDQLLEKSVKKHVSSPKLFRYVASISAVIVLGFSTWLVVFKNADTESKKNDTFAFFFNGFKSEKEILAEKIKLEQAEWQAKKTEMKKEAEQIVFTEDEFLYMEYLAEEEEDYFEQTDSEIEL
mgnify:CR=1 FL=1